MLPRGLTADLASSADHQDLKSLHPPALTVARILVGRCSCDLVRARLSDATEDERHLRERYRRLNVPRPAVIAALDRHRRAGTVRGAANDWPGELGKFVAEHGRNAGPTLYLLRFQPDDSDAQEHANSGSPSQVRLRPDQWLIEGIPVVV